MALIDYLWKYIRLYINRVIILIKKRYPTLHKDTESCKTRNIIVNTNYINTIYNECIKHKPINAPTLTLNSRSNSIVKEIHKNSKFKEHNHIEYTEYVNMQTWYKLFR